MVVLLHFGTRHGLGACVSGKGLAVVVVALWLAGSLGAADVEGKTARVTQSVQAMVQAAGGPLSVTRSRTTGLATFITGGQDRAIPMAVAKDATPRAVALAFV